MKTLSLSVALVVLGCTSSVPVSAPVASPAEPPHQKQPMIDPMMQLRVLPGDVVSWVQQNPPTFTLEVQHIDRASGQDVLTKLAAVAGFEVRGKPVAGKASIEGWPLETDFEGQSGVVWPRVVVRGTQSMPAGWQTFTLDLKALGVAIEADVPTVNGVARARFNLGESPTVRSVLACESTGELRVQFSEPVLSVAPASKTVSLTDVKGQPIGCAKGLGGALLSADGETLSIACELPLPSTLGVALDPRGFVSTVSRRPLLDLTGATFAATIDLPTLPLSSDGRCGTWGP